MPFGYNPAAPHQQAFSVTPGGLKAPWSTFTRPANTTAYAQYDLISNSTSAATLIELSSMVRTDGEAFRWEGARLYSSNPLAKTKTFRVHLFSASTALAVNDNDAFNASGAQTLGVASVASYIGYIDVTLSEAGTAGAAGRAGLDYMRTIQPASGTSLYWCLEARDSAGYTPISQETFTFVPEGQWA